jgi:tRNA (guanosine-2'-O-)-methyltransferase
VARLGSPVKQLGSTDLKRLHREWNRHTPGRLALLLDGVQSPFNVGAIVRTAAALRVNHIYLTPAAAAPGHPQAQRLAMGTDRYLNSQVLPSAPEGVLRARSDGYRVVAIELANGARPLHGVDLTGDICLVLGNEDHGIGRDCLAAVDQVAFLPQLGKVGSLNVAAAAAMALYEVRRQAWTSPDIPPASLPPPPDP